MKIKLKNSCYTVAELLTLTGNPASFVAACKEHDWKFELDFRPEWEGQSDSWFPWDASFIVDDDASSGMSWVGVCGPGGGLRDVSIKIALRATDVFFVK